MVRWNAAMARMMVALILGLTNVVGCSAQSDHDRPSTPPSHPPAAQEQAPPQVEPTGSTAPDAAIAAGSWPRFHGADGRNMSPDTGLLKKWPDDGPPLVWKTSGIGEGFASVTIGDGLIFTDGNIEGKTVITAMDLGGKIRWQAENGPAWTEQYEGTRGTPTIDGDRVYHESPLGNVVCLNTKNHERLWSLNILDEFGAKNIKWALAESLLIDGDRLICCPGGPKVSMVALDKMTGKTVWTAKSTGDPASYASPILVQCQGLRILMTLNAKALIGVNADTGQLLWRHEHVTQYEVNATMPLYYDGSVFISTGYRSGSELLRIKVNGTKADVEQVWSSKDLDNHHGGVILVDGYIYGAAHSSNNGKWICLDWKTGKMLYAERGVGKGSVTFADGMLYTMSENGKVGLVPATPKNHTVVSQFQLPRDGKGPTWAHPVVCGGRLYLRHGDWLYAYDIRAK